MHINVVKNTTTLFSGRKNEKRKSTRIRDELFKELMWQCKDKTDFRENWQALDFFLWSCCIC